MCCHVVWYIIADVSEEHFTTVYRFEEYSETLAMIYLTS
jgi:hypothetical protein